MKMKKTDIDLFKDGKRYDGRKPEELRPIFMKTGVLKRANGSAYVEWGKNKAMAGVYGPRPCFSTIRQEKARPRQAFS